MAIQMRRGGYAHFDPTRMLPGEYAVVLENDPDGVDGYAVYMCYASGVVKRLVSADDVEAMIHGESIEWTDIVNRPAVNPGDGIDSVEEGYGTTAAGNYSHAEGYNTQTASGGSYSHAEGYGTTASGTGSHAEGQGTVANHWAQHVFGTYNTPDPSTAGPTQKGTYVEIVGNGIGTGDMLSSNARTLDWSGNEVLKGKLTVGAAPTADMDVATKKYVDDGVDDLTDDINDLKQDLEGLDVYTLGLYPQMSVADTAVASFTDGADDIPVKALEVAIDPVQDLHGYANPWPGGGGKNKLDSSSAQSTTTSGVTFTVTKNQDGQATKIHIQGTSTETISYTIGSATLAAGTYTFNAVETGGAIGSLMLNYSGIVNVGSSAVTQAITEQKTTTVTLQIASGLAVNTDFYPMIRISTDSADFAPYSNICPISGWTGAKVTRTGKNLFDGESWLQANNIEYTVVNGYLQFQASSTLYNHFFDVFSGTKTVSFEVGSGTTATNVRLRVKYANGTIDDNMYTTATGDIVGVAINYSNNGLIQLKIQLEEGSTATAYEPFGTVYSVDWTTEAGTVYGGTLDVTSGVLTVTNGMIELDGTQEILGSSYSGNAYVQYRISELGNAAKEGGAYKSNRYKNYGSGATTDYISQYQESYPRILVRDSRFGVTITNNAGWNTWLASNHVQFMYELATPVTYQLTPTEVATILGQNNIFADTGNVAELTYRADLKAYIDSVIS